MKAMSEKAKSPTPYKDLGTKLKQMRAEHHESLAEVSGAVEIDTDDLATFERGELRPAEDILLLLISHFGIKEDEALQLWEMAGYDMQRTPAAHMVNTNDGSAQSKVIVAQTDTRILYTDTVHVMVNNYGVVMNFMQASGTGTQPVMISRIGMSKEHAKSVLEVLQKTLEAADSTSQPQQLSDGL